MSQQQGRAFHRPPPSTHQSPDHVTADDPCRGCGFASSLPGRPSTRLSSILSQGRPGRPRHRVRRDTHQGKDFSFPPNDPSPLLSLPQSGPAGPLLPCSASSSAISGRPGVVSVVCVGLGCWTMHHDLQRRALLRHPVSQSVKASGERDYLPGATWAAVSAPTPHSTGSSHPLTASIRPLDFRCLHHCHAWSSDQLLVSVWSRVVPLAFGRCVGALIGMSGTLSQVASRRREVLRIRSKYPALPPARTLRTH